MLIHPDLGFFDEGLDLRSPDLFAAASKPYGEASRMPSVVFRSKIFADLEDEMVWTRAWVALGLQQQISNPGDILPYTVGNHGIHVQRSDDLGLVGRFNKAQHGGCRAVPLQCQTGNKTKCSFTSCGYSRDRDEILALEVNEAQQIAHQYLGLVPERLLPVQVEAVGPIIFANLDHGAGKRGKSKWLPRFARSQNDAAAQVMFQRSHFECAANWKIVMRALGEAPAGPHDGESLWWEVKDSTSLRSVHRPDPQTNVGGGDPDGSVAGYHRIVHMRSLGNPLEDPSLGSLWWHFPNLFVGKFDSHMVVLIVQPVGLAETRLRYFLMSSHGERSVGSEILEQTDRAWRAQIKRQLSAAELIQKEIQTWGTAASPDTSEDRLPLEQSACGYALQRFLTDKLMQNHEYHWSAPVFRGEVR